MKLDFHGKTVLVLGGGCTIGLALTGLLLEEGLTVIPTHASEDGKAAIYRKFPELTGKSPWLDLGDKASQATLAPLLQTGADYLVDLAHADHGDADRVHRLRAPSRRPALGWRRRAPACCARAARKARRQSRTCRLPAC